MRRTWGIIVSWVLNSFEEASGISTVLLMDPGLVFWNCFKNRHCSILNSKKQCQNFWSLKSWVLNSSEEASGISTVLLMDPSLVFWNCFKNRHCSILNSKNRVKIFGLWNHEFWRSIWDVNRCAHGPGSCHLKPLQNRHCSLLSSKRIMSNFWSLKSGTLKNHLGFKYNFW